MTSGLAVRKFPTRVLLWVLPWVVVLTAASVPARAETGEHPISSLIDTWVVDRMAAHGIPGAAVAVVQGGKTIHLRGYGNADATGQAVGIDTPFLIGSASKPFTANIVLQLVDEGVLVLDEPVLSHLGHLVQEPPEGFERVTVRQLLNHTSGLSMSNGLAGTVAIHTSPDALARRVADLLRPPLSGSPGSRFEYSNAGPMLLAAVVEQVTGDRFDQVLQDRIFATLGMTDTFASEDHPSASRLATGHRLWFGRWRPAELPYDPAGVAMGYIGSSARDLALFMHAHLQEPPATSVPMGAADIADEPIVATGWDVPLETGHGLGWFVDHLAGHRVVSHSGSLGHFTTHLIMVPDADGLGIAVLTNASAFIAAGHAGQYDLSLGLARLLLDEQPEPAARSTLYTSIYPIAAWAFVVLLFVTIGRHLTRTLPRWKRKGMPSEGGSPRWLRHAVLPAAGYLTVGAALLVLAPLAAARHFYPDVGWAVTTLAWLTLIWGLIRLVRAVSRPRSRRQSRHVLDGVPPGLGDRMHASDPT